MKLYSTNCPKCNVIEKKLRNKNIEFEKITDFDHNKMKERGFSFAPILETNDGILLDYSDANNYINAIK